MSPQSRRTPEAEGWPRSGGGSIHTCTYLQVVLTHDTGLLCHWSSSNSIFIFSETKPMCT